MQEVKTQCSPHIKHAPAQCIVTVHWGRGAIDHRILAPTLGSSRSPQTYVGRNHTARLSLFWIVLVESPQNSFSMATIAHLGFLANFNFESFVVISASAVTSSGMYFLFRLLTRFHTNSHGQFVLFEASIIFNYF